MPLATTILHFLTLRRVSLWHFPSDPKALALLWLGGAAALSLSQLSSEYWFIGLGLPFAQLGGVLLAGLLGAWLLGRRSEALRLAFALMLVAVPYLLLRAGAGRLISDGNAGAPWIAGILMLWAMGTVLRLVISLSSWSGKWAKVGTVVAMGATLLLSLEWPGFETELISLVAQAETGPAYPEVDAEELWTAQPALLVRALERLPKANANASAGRPRIFIVTVAAGGMQQLFGREAGKVREVLEHRFGVAGQGLTLSNATADLARVPLANRTNLGVVLGGVGKQFDQARDLAVIYLASHGSRDGSMSTDLPNYTTLNPISARFLAQALNDAGISRRIVVVSACYAGTWIKPLASPDTIVIAASAPDRTSFGCDDERTYTVFGEAVINSSLSRGASLNDAFVAIKRRIEAEELGYSAAHSRPEAFVGERMQEVWNRRD